MNAGPFSARLLTDAPLPHWLKEPEEVKGAAREGSRPLPGPWVIDREARPAVLDCQSRHRHDRGGQCQPGERSRVGQVGGGTAG